MPTDDLSHDKTVLQGEPVGRPVTRLGRYILKQRLGIGGMAEVYLAEQDGPQQFKKRVVVKRILPSLAADAAFVAMFVREAQVAARLSHGNVVQIYELGEQRHEGALPGEAASTEYFIAMELIDGLTLQRLATASWHAGRALPNDVVVRTVADAARGLHAAHTLTDDEGKPLHLVHRDISPDNLMVSRDGVTKVLDFGIAKGEIDGPKTRTGNLRGKVPYMSPEQISGQPLDGRCDLWALGVSLYWLLCGERPFDRGTDFHTMQAILQEPARRPTTINPGIPPALEALILRLLEKDRARRPATAALVADELEEMAAPGTGSGRRTTVAFLEQFLADSQGAGNPLSESGDRTSHTRPLAASTARSGDLDPVLTEDTAGGQPRNVTLPGAAMAPSSNRAPADAPVPPLPTGVASGSAPGEPSPGGPSSPSAPSSPSSPSGRPSGNHPVVDLLATPKQSAVPAVLVVIGVMAVLLAAGGFGVWKVATLLASAEADGDAGAVAAADVDARQIDAGQKGLPSALDADSLAVLPAVSTAVDAGAAIVAPVTPSDAGTMAAPAIVDAGNLMAPTVVDAGPSRAADPGPAAGPRPSNKVVLRAKAPARVTWSLEDGTVLGQGNAALSLPRGTPRVVAEDKQRHVTRTLDVVAGQALDYASLPAGTLTVKQAEGMKVFLERDLITETTPVAVVEGTYELRVARGAVTVARRKLDVKAGQAIVVDAARP